MEQYIAATKFLKLVNAPPGSREQYTPVHRPSGDGYISPTPSARGVVMMRTRRARGVRTARRAEAEKHRDANVTE